MAARKRKSGLEPRSREAEEEAAMECLRRNHPEFFADPTFRDLAAVILSEMGDELAKHGPVERSTMIAVIISLMYRMGTAALKTTRDEQERDMGRIFVDTYRSEPKE
jgi:hypothetical protein